MGAVGSAGDDVGYINVVVWKRGAAIMCRFSGFYQGTNVYN